MTLNQLYYFRAVAELQSYRKAAERLHISQPSLSVAIANLEDEFGVKLFERVGRNVALTKLGRVFQGQIENILTQLEQAASQMKSHGSGKAGHIDLAYMSAVTHWIPKVVRQFLNANGGENSGITFGFHESTTPYLLDGLKSGRYDLVLNSAYYDDPALASVPLLRQELVAIVPPGHPLAAKSCIDLKELAPYPLVTYMPHIALRPTIDAYIRQAGFEPRIACEATNEEAIAGLVAADFGVSLVARLDTLDLFEIKQLSIRNPECSRIIHMYRLKDQYLPPAMERFLKFMEEVSPYLVSAANQCLLED